MSNHARRRMPVDLTLSEPPPGLLRRAWLFLVWFFTPRAFPRAWQRRPYLRDPNRRPGRSSR